MKPILAQPPGIVVFAHGSRIESANEAVRSVARELAQAGGFPAVKAAFLELGHPDLPTAIASLAASGSQTILVLPYFLTLGLHLERDLPRLIKEISISNNNLDIIVTPPLDGHPALVQVLLDRARQALPKT
jgi:sirohydrochlorin cobaltochelatase